MEKVEKDTFSNFEKLFHRRFKNYNPQELVEEIEWNSFISLIQIVMKRKQFFEENLSSVNTLNKYIEYHKSSNLIRKRLAIEVAGKRIALKRFLRMSETDLSAMSDEEIYLELVKLNMTTPRILFSEAPPPIDLCQLLKAKKEIEKFQKSGRLTADEAAASEGAIKDAMNSELQYIDNRWRAITGKSLDIANFPPLLSELIERKGPLPSASIWSYKKYGVEARAMHQKQYKKGWPGERDDEDNEHNREADSNTEEIRRDNADSNDESGEFQNQMAEERCASLNDCCVDKIMNASGGNNLRTPTGSEPRYTFPQQLRRGEDIFYDYSIIIPVEEECGPCQNEYSEESRSLLSIKILVGKGKAIIDFLRNMNFAKALGEYEDPNSHQSIPVIETIEELLNRSASLGANEGPLSVIELRRDCRDLAASLRMISKIESWMPPSISDFVSLSAQLRTTANELVTSNPSRHIPTHKDAGSEARSKRVIESPRATLPNADETNYATTAEGWIYRNPTQFKELRAYLINLQADLFPKINALKQKAIEAADSLSNANLGYSDYSDEFNKMAEGLINDTSYVLSMILDSIAEQLQLPRKIAIPGSKRLALQIIFRQYWFTEGYVQGKLVGYKSLTPNEKEIVKRRSFVKTLVETTTAREFASARQDDYSQTQKQTSEMMKEVSSKFNFTSNSSGHFQFAVWGGQASVGLSLDLAKTSKSAQSSISEAVAKSSIRYNEKRETKIRELKESEDVKEVERTIHNSNQEITANYFYYQLLRQYCVTTQLYDMRTVILRSRELPSPAEIDENWLSRYLHVLIHALPSQLSLDAQEFVDEINPLSRALVRRRAEMNDLKADKDAFMEGDIPTDDPEKLSQWKEELRIREMRLSDAREEYFSAEQSYAKARSKIDRVISHLRENICYYMQFIWQASPRTDHEMLLRQDKFCGYPFPQVTQGLNLLGYNGNEEIYEYTGKSAALFQALITNMTSGDELVGASDELGEEWNNVIEFLEHYYDEGGENLLEKLITQGFIKDPALMDELFMRRRIQIAEDALVVEAMPGQVPLLEGFQMAHRMLNIEKSCLENKHLRERVIDKAWQNEGNDTYAVRRYDGNLPPQRESVENS